MTFIPKYSFVQRNIENCDINSDNDVVFKTKIQMSLKLRYKFSADFIFHKCTILDKYLTFLDNKKKQTSIV